MRSAIIIAAFLSGALAVPGYGYGDYPAESSTEAPEYPSSTEAPVYGYPTSTEAAETPYYPASTEAPEQPYYGATSTEEAEAPCSTSVEYPEYPSSTEEAETPCSTSVESPEYPSYPSESAEVPTYPEATPTECPTSTVYVTVTQGPGGYSQAPYPVPTGYPVAPTYPAGTGTGAVYPTNTPPAYEGAASNVKAGMAIAGLGAIAAFFL
jgi:hypothetical protein